MQAVKHDQVYKKLTVYKLLSIFIIPLPTHSVEWRYSISQQKFLSFFSFAD